MVGMGSSVVLHGKEDWKLWRGQLFSGSLKVQERDFISSGGQPVTLPDKHLRGAELPLQSALDLLSERGR